MKTELQYKRKDALQVREKQWANKHPPPLLT